METSDKDIDALIAMLDGQMKKGSKHVNIAVEDPTNMNASITQIKAGIDCDSGDTACKIPNLMTGLDQE